MTMPSSMSCRNCRRNCRRICAGLFPAARLGGTYVQTRGPRFETVAEIAALSRFADLVGMTLASEATLARELGMPFAAVCTVDNYANGLADGVLTWDEMLEISRQYRERTGRILEYDHQADGLTEEN